jgi:hypothetical protein
MLFLVSRHSSLLASTKGFILKERSMPVLSLLLTPFEQEIFTQQLAWRHAFYLATLLPVIMLVGLILLAFLVIPSISLALTLANPASYIAREITMHLIMIVSLGFSFISLKQGCRPGRPLKLHTNHITLSIWQLEIFTYHVIGPACQS